MAQPPQPQEQELLPFLLLMTMRTTMATKIAPTTAATSTVGQSIIVTSSLFYFYVFVFTDEHIDDDRQRQGRKDGADDIAAADKPCTKLVND